MLRELTIGRGFQWRRVIQTRLKAFGRCTVVLRASSETHHIVHLLLKSRQNFIGGQVFVVRRKTILSPGSVFNCKYEL